MYIKDERLHVHASISRTSAEATAVPKLWARMSTSKPGLQNSGLGIRV